MSGLMERTYVSLIGILFAKGYGLAAATVPFEWY